MTWIEQVNERGTWDVALALGLQRYDRTHLGPCPVCRAERRSRRDRRRGSVFLVGSRGWKCGSCDAGGDAVRMVACVAFGEPLIKGDLRWRELRDICASRGWCEPRRDAPERAVWRPAPPPVPAPEPERHRAPVDELEDLWARSLPVTDDPEVAAWLESRSLSPVAVADLDLARALPVEGRLPRWARFQGLPWSAGWRCLVRCWGPTGQLESLRARWVSSAPLPDGAEKAGAAAAGPGSASGMLLGCSLARQVLATGEAPSWLTGALRIVVAEGEPDWLTWASRWTDAQPDAPAVVGVWNGAWTDEIAARIPDGARVVVRVHHDETGVRYAERVLRSLRGRCDLYRSRGPHADAA